jgi:mRNA-degrading endonuclease RelE of RelBE toxin-antitoxin system
LRTYSGPVDRCVRPPKGREISEAVPEHAIVFAIELTTHARGHLRQFRKRDQRIIIDAIAVQLTHEPDQPTQHRKQLDENALAPWELRVGDIRISYDVSREEGNVIVLAIGEKDHNRLRVGGEEIEL